MNRIPLKVVAEDIETVPEGQVENLLSETTDTDATVTLDENADTDEGDEESRKDGGTASGRPGIDAVLRDVREKLSPQHEEVIRGLQKNFSQGNELEADRRRLREALDEVEALRKEMESDDEDSEEDSVSQMLDRVNPQQMQLLEAWAKREGFVKQDDLDDIQKNDLLDETNRQDYERFGDDFGSFDDGEFKLNPEAHKKCAPIYHRLVEQQMLQFGDLYRLANFDELVEAARMQGRNGAIKEIKESQLKRVGAAVQGTVATTSAGGEMRNKLYDPAEYGDGKKPTNMRSRISDVMRKAREDLRRAS